MADPAVQAARALILEKRGQGDMFVDDLAELLVAAVTPLIRQQAFTEAADAIQTTRTGGGWKNNINIGLHKAELLVRGLGEGTANR